MHETEVLMPSKVYIFFLSAWLCIPAIAWAGSSNALVKSGRTTPTWSKVRPPDGCVIDNGPMVTLAPKVPCSVTLYKPGLATSEKPTMRLEIDSHFHSKLVNCVSKSKSFKEWTLDDAQAYWGKADKINDSTYRFHFLTRENKSAEVKVTMDDHGNFEKFEIYSADIIGHNEF